MTLVIGAKTIADKFNEYLTEIGSKWARSIDIANKLPFTSYRNAPHAASFNFAYTNPDDIEMSERNIRLKSNASYDKISTKFLQNWTCHVASIEHCNQQVTM